MRHAGLALALALLALMPAANAQTITGSVFGSVADSGGGVITNAGVQLTNDVSKQSRSFITDSNGDFQFNSTFRGIHAANRAPRVSSL